MNRERRTLPAQTLSLALLLGLLLCLPQSLVSQGRRPLSPHHWSYGLTEALHALGLPGTTLPLVRGTSLASQQWDANATPELEAFLTTWTRRLDQERGREGKNRYAQVSAGWTEDHALPRSAPKGNLGAVLAGEMGWGGTLWVEPYLAQGPPEESTLRSGGLSIPAGSFDLFLGRLPTALGQGMESFVLNGYEPLDGAFLNSREPFRFPSFLEALGPSTLHLGVSPFISTPLAPSAWWGSFGLGFSPHPRVDLGVMRTVRFAGEGLEEWSPGNVFRMFTLAGESNSFDDSQGELSVRIRWDLLGQPLSTYLSVGFEDKATVYEDPGLLAGVLVPFLRPEALYTLKYEFMAYGGRAIWCGGCEREFHAWYRHPAFGDYMLEDDLLGSMLGGYGASHRGRLEGWFSHHPIRAWAEYQHLSRENRNLIRILDRGPAQVKGWELGLESGLGSGPLSSAQFLVSGALQRVSLDGEQETGFSVSLTIIPGI